MNSNAEVLLDGRERPQILGGQSWKSQQINSDRRNIELQKMLSGLRKDSKRPMSSFERIKHDLKGVDTSQMVHK